MHDVLSRILVVVILGEEQIVEAHSEMHQTERAHTSQLRIRKALAAHRTKDPIAAFTLAASELYAQGDRMIVLTGYPRTAAEAMSLRRICPNLVTFSIEKPGEVYGTDDPRKILPQREFHSVDSRRSGGSRHAFMRNYIDRLITELEIRASAKTIAPTGSKHVPEPAYA